MLVERSVRTSAPVTSVTWTKRLTLSVSSAVIHGVLLTLAVFVMSSSSGGGGRGGQSAGFGANSLSVSFLHGTSQGSGSGTGTGADFDNTLSEGSQVDSENGFDELTTRIDTIAAPALNSSLNDVARVFEQGTADVSIQELRNAATRRPRVVDDQQQQDPIAQSTPESRSIEIPEDERATLQPVARPRTEQSSISQPTTGEFSAALRNGGTRSNNSGTSGGALNEADGGGRPGSGGTRGFGRGDGSGTGAGDRTRFFGIDVRAKRFVYVIDASDSMLQNRAMELARNELWLSLQELAPPTKFQVVFFNLEQQALARPGEKPQLLLASPTNLRLAAQFLAEVQTDSGTDRLRALSYALKLEPEALFLLTDADAPVMTAPDLAKLRTLNRNRSVIHVVEFGKRSDISDDNFLKAIARQNGGTHRYVDLTDTNFGL